MSFSVPELAEVAGSISNRRSTTFEAEAIPEAPAIELTAQDDEQKTVPHYFDAMVHRRAKSCYESHDKKETLMAKTLAKRKRNVRRDWSRTDVKDLRQHSRAKTPVKTISRALKRTPGAVRQKAHALGIPLGHVRRKRKRA